MPEIVIPDLSHSLCLEQFRKTLCDVVGLDQIANLVDTYDELYIKNQDLDVFYNSAKLGKMVEVCLKKSNVYTPAQKNDILFYVLYLSVAKRVGNANITFKDVKEIELNSYTDEYITQIAEIVFSEYEKLGGDGKVAKGSDLIDNLISLFSTPEDHSDLA